MSHLPQVTENRFLRYAENYPHYPTPKRCMTQTRFFSGASHYPDYPDSRIISRIMGGHYPSRNYASFKGFTSQVG